MSLTLVWFIGKCDLTDCVHPVYTKNMTLPTMSITVTFAPKQKHQTNNNNNKKKTRMANCTCLHDTSLSINQAAHRTQRTAEFISSKRCFCYIVAMQNHSTKHRRMKQFHFWGAERNIHHDRGNLCCSWFSPNLSVL